MNIVVRYASVTQTRYSYIIHMTILNLQNNNKSNFPVLSFVEVSTIGCQVFLSARPRAVDSFMKFFRRPVVGSDRAIEVICNEKGGLDGSASCTLTQSFTISEASRRGQQKKK